MNLLEGFQGYSKRYSISARARKYYCPICWKTVQVRVKSQIIDTKSEEAKNFDFPVFEGGAVVGKVKFVWDVFYCASCDKEITITEMREFERETKRREREEKRVGSERNERFRLLLRAAVLLISFVLVVMLVYANR